MGCCTGCSRGVSCAGGCGARGYGMAPVPSPAWAYPRSMATLGGMFGRSPLVPALAAFPESAMGMVAVDVAPAGATTDTSGGFWSSLGQLAQLGAQVGQTAITQGQQTARAQAEATANVDVARLNAESQTATAALASDRQRQLMWALGGLAVAGGVGAAIYYASRRRRRR